MVIPIEPSTVIDISSVIDVKSDMLACHESQRDWLKEHHGMDEYLFAMKRQSEETGKKINRAYAEGFRQHLGHAYPQNNLLQEALARVMLLYFSSKSIHSTIQPLILMHFHFTIADSRSVIIKLHIGMVSQ